MKAAEQHSPVVLFVKPYKVVLTLETLGLEESHSAAITFGGGLLFSIDCFKLMGALRKSRV